MRDTCRDSNHKINSGRAGLDRFLGCRCGEVTLSGRRPKLFGGLRCTNFGLQPAPRQHRVDGEVDGRACGWRMGSLPHLTDVLPRPNLAHWFCLYAQQPHHLWNVLQG